MFVAGIFREVEEGRRGKDMVFIEENKCFKIKRLKSVLR